MNDLLERKRLLEGKLALGRASLSRLHKEWKDKQNEADEIQHRFENVRVDMFKDEQALEEVNRQIDEMPPTLSRNMEKKNPLWKELIACIAFALITSAVYPQPSVSWEAGNRMGLNIGYQVNKAVVKAGALVPYTRSTVISNITYAGIGYKIGDEINITPIAGVAHYHNTIKGLQEISKTVLMTSAEIGHDFTTANNHFGNYYLFVSRACQFYGGAGLRVFIK